MIAPRKVKFEAKKKENENIEFRTFLKCNADEKELDVAHSPSTPHQRSVRVRNEDVQYLYC